MSWKIVGDIHEIASAPASSVEAEERIRGPFVMAEDSVLARPGLDADAFRTYLAMNGATRKRGRASDARGAVQSSASRNPHLCR